jgi:hypothetical protein
VESQHSMFGIRVAAKVVCSRRRPATRTEGQESRAEGRPGLPVALGTN